MNQKHRTALIAGLLIALLCVLALAAPMFWRILAYEKIDIPGEHPWLRSELKANLATYFKKRWDWLPGDRLILPDQVCGYCQVDLHEYCSDGWDSLNIPINDFFIGGE